MNTNMTEQFITLHFNDGVTLQLSTSSFLYKNSSFLRLFDIEEDNNIPILCPSTYVLDNNDTFLFDDKSDLFFMLENLTVLQQIKLLFSYNLRDNIFINLCKFLDIIEYENTDNKFSEQFILYVMKYDLIHQLKDLHAFMRGEIKSILNYTENISADIQVRTCTSLFYKLYLSEYKEEVAHAPSTDVIGLVIKNGRADIYYDNITEYYKYIHKYDNQLTYIVKETQEYKDYITNISNQLLDESNKKNNIKKIKELVENGANVNVQNNNDSNALYRAAYQENNIEVIQYLIEHGADVNLQTTSNDTALHRASRLSNNLVVIQYLIKYCANVNLQNKDGNTALHHASYQKNNLKVVQYLVEHGANVNLQNNYGSTALHLASCHLNNIEIIQYLVEHGTDVNIKNIDDSNALHCASHLMYWRNGYSNIDNNLKVIQYLVEHCTDRGEAFDGCNSSLNAQNNEGNTALHYVSIQLNNRRVIQYLVEHGADINIKNKNGRNASHKL